MQKWYTYILECADKTFYVGITNNVEERVAKHNSGKGAKYTRGRGPVAVKFIRSFESRAEASKHEYALKQYSRDKKIEVIKSKENEL